MDRIKVLFIYRNKNIAKKFIEHFTINNYEVYEFYGNSIPKAKLNFWQKIEKPILALAPMAGFSDSPFRIITSEYGADVVYSEMASVASIFFHQKEFLSGD